MPYKNQQPGRTGHITLFTYYYLVSLLAFVTRGKPFFVKKKLLIGAMLIAMSAAQTGCDDEQEIAVCYAGIDPGASLMDSGLVTDAATDSGNKENDCVCFEDDAGIEADAGTKD